MQRTKRTIPYLVICIISLVVFFVPFGNADELWNYNFARNISVGLLPYKDFSIVQTPLSAYLASIFIIVFGQGLFSIRILGYILFSSISCISYKIFRESQNAAISCVAIMFSMSLLVLSYIYNYNFLSAFFVLVIMKLEGSKSQNKTALNIIIGSIVGILPLIKQSTGFAIMVGNILICSCFFMLKKCTLKQALLRISVSLIPSFIYCCFLLLTGTFTYFYEYAIKGLGTFVHRFSPIDLFIEAPVFGIILIIIACIILIICIKAVRDLKELTSQQISALIMSLAWCSIAYPLCDGHHVLCITITTVPTLLLFYQNKKTKSIENYVCVFTATLVAAIALIYMLPIGKEYHFSTLKNYEMVLITDSYEKPILEMDKYIIEREREGYHIRIADISAAAVKIPLDLYEKNWDMLLVGNLGLNSVEDLLEEKEPTLYLVVPGDHEELQEHRELIYYITENYTKVDHVGWFDVYENQKTN